MPTRPATRDSETGWGNEEGVSTTRTYAAAARRNLTPFYHQSIDTSRAGRWNRSYSRVTISLTHSLKPYTCTVMTLGTPVKTLKEIDLTMCLKT
ncbi:hypothetical protein E2C01_043306 [Portunus trituberculatus]|uniref:Uncharacterized protein n=1 Tax=Portunus trituberculatus TaxID=210409 RepID=A0A5B7FWY9_PORTR|nr:hypothetical protein [Portunus trituberculatus]